jgi:hypothetical protein
MQKKNLKCAIFTNLTQQPSQSDLPWSMLEPVKLSTSLTKMYITSICNDNLWIVKNKQSSY